jgi:hypothetical protein
MTTNQHHNATSPIPNNATGLIATENSVFPSKIPIPAGNGANRIIIPLPNAL